MINQVLGYSSVDLVVCCLNVCFRLHTWNVHQIKGVLDARVPFYTYLKSDCVTLFYEVLFSKIFFIPEVAKKFLLFLWTEIFKWQLMWKAVN